MKSMTQFWLRTLAWLNEDDTIENELVKSGQSRSSLIGLIPLAIALFAFGAVGIHWAGECCGDGEGDEGKEVEIEVYANGTLDGSVDFTFGPVSGTLSAGDCSQNSITVAKKVPLDTVLDKELDWHASGKCKSVTFSISVLGGKCGKKFVAQESSFTLSPDSNEDPQPGGQCSRSGCKCACKPHPDCPNTDCIEGKIDCGDCTDGKTSGNETCQTCGGDDMITVWRDCDSCFGSGNEPCGVSSCSGGQIPNPDYDQGFGPDPECPLCGGVGCSLCFQAPNQQYVDCTSCVEGVSTCSGCLGTLGYEETTNCDNSECDNGQVPYSRDCLPCNATGKIDCTTCNGTGKDPEYQPTSSCDCAQDEPNICTCSCCHNPTQCKQASKNGTFSIVESGEGGSEGDGETNNGCLDWGISLGGRQSDGKHAGKLRLYEETISPLTFQVQGLKFGSMSSGIELRGQIGSSWLSANKPSLPPETLEADVLSRQQIKTEKVLVEMRNEPDGSGYTLDFYPNSSVDPASGLQTTNPGNDPNDPSDDVITAPFFELLPEAQSPLVSWKIERINSPHPTGVIAEAKITETRGDLVRVTVFREHGEVVSGTSVVTEWEMEKSGMDGFQLVRKVKNSSANLRIETETVEGPDGTVYSKSIKTRQSFPWGWETTSVENFSSVGANAESDVTMYTYGTTSGQSGYGKRHTETHSDGTWKRFGYSDPDDANIVAKVPVVIYESWTGAEGEAVGPNTATLTNCKVERRTFGNAGPGADEDDVSMSQTFIMGVKTGEVVYSRVKTPEYITTSKVTTQPAVLDIDRIDDDDLDDDGLDDDGLDDDGLADSRDVDGDGTDDIPEQDSDGDGLDDDGLDGDGFDDDGFDDDGLDDDGYKDGGFMTLTEETIHSISAPVHERGKPVRTMSADGTVDYYLYFPGVWNEGGPGQALGSWTNDSYGFGCKTVVIRSVLGSPSGVPGKSTKRVTYSDADGRLRQSENWVMNSTGNYIVIKSERMIYDTFGHLVQKLQNGTTPSDVTLDQVWDEDRLVRRVDFDGYITEYTYDVLDRVKTETYKGVESSNAFEAQEDITTTYHYDPAGRVLSVTRSAGLLSQSSSKSYDLLGRTLSSTDVQGRTTEFTFSNAGRTVMESLPSGGQRIAKRSIDGELIEVTATGQPKQIVLRSVLPNGNIKTETQIGPNGERVSWVENTVKGHTLRQAKMNDDGSFAVTQFYLNDQGRAVKVLPPIGAAQIKVYDEFGTLTGEWLDLNGNGTLDLASAEPVTLHSKGIQQINGGWWEVHEQAQLASDGSATDKLIRSSRHRLGLVFTQEEVNTSPAGQVSTRQSITDRNARTRSEKVITAPAGGGSESLSRNGLLQWSWSDAQNEADTYQYDALARRTKAIDGRTLAYQEWAYDSLGRVTSTRDLSGGVTTKVYHEVLPPSAKAGRIKYVEDASGARQYFEYNAAGRVTHIWGSGTYPLEYDFDEFGQMTEMHTFQGGADWGSDTLPAAFTTAAAAVTTWEYFESSGRLHRKYDAAEKFTEYAYNVRGQLTERKWARTTVGGAALKTIYGYDDAGRQISVNYSDATPDVSISYDRAGRRTGLEDAAGAHAFSYSTAAAGQLTSLTVSGTGPWSGMSLGYSYDAFARREGRTASMDGKAVPAVSFDYDEFGRLNSIGTMPQGAAALSATYRYVEGAGTLIDGITYQQGTQVKLVSTRTLDDAGRLEAIAWWDGDGSGANLLSGHDYTLDAVGRRTSAMRENGASWSYGYNVRGEVISAAKSDDQEEPEPGKQYSYTYDAIGNRTASAVSGLTSGALTHSTGYTTNELNQYTARSNPGRLVLRGGTHPDASVQIDGAAPTVTRADGTWDHETSIDNSSGAVRRNLSITATRPGVGLNGGNVTTTQSGSRPVPPATETLTYDDDGNLLSDGHWFYTWDAENRLIRQEESAAILIQPPGSPPLQRRRLDFAYDAGSRRIRKAVSVADGNGTTFVLKQQTVFLYDGWNMIAEYDTLNATQLVRSYEWGLDVSGTMSGAGGVGGLIVMREHANNTGTIQSSHAPLFDGNGNVMELCSLTTSSLSARYEYSAYGETIRVEGAAIADANPFRFSTKFQDSESGWYYYGFRYYSPEMGRWPSRDPIGERGGRNLYGMVGNNAVNRIDRLGLIEYNFDETACTLNVKIKWKLTFGHYNSDEGKFHSGDGWTEDEKAKWKEEAESAVEGYYSKLKKKCKPNEKCCPCRNGVEVKFDLEYVDADADMVVKVSNSPWHRGSRMGPTSGNLDEDDTQPTDTGYGNQQITIVHEMGHGLGLDHPGHDSNPPAEPDSHEDYDADKKSLMGRGMTLRPKDQNKAFCSKIKPAGQTEKPCAYSVK